MLRDEIGTRMKRYENVNRNYLTPRTPVIIRIDGKAFHTFSKGFEKPFDEIMVKSMQDTMKYLCENIQGCVLGYTQSDEITLILIDYEKLDTNAWFDYNIQKCVSVSSSMATLAFNKAFIRNVKLFNKESNIIYINAIEKGALFDSRIFNIPKEEVTNCLFWRQLDASINSVQSLGFANFSHKEMQGKSCSQVQDMLMLQKNINWNDLATTLKRGSCCIKKQIGERSQWVIDNEIPIFKNDGRKYIENLIYIGE